MSNIELKWLKLSGGGVPCTTPGAAARCKHLPTISIKTSCTFINELRGGGVQNSFSRILFLYKRFAIDI